MKQVSIQFPLIRNAALTFAFTAISCMTVYGICYYYKTLWQQRHNELADTITQLNYDITDRYADIAIYEEYIDRYTFIHAAGYLNFGNRIDWVQSLEKTTADLRLDQLDYKIDPTIVSNVTINDTETIKIYETPIDITAAVAHEGDIVSFYNNLASTVGMGILNSKSCDISRDNNQSEGGYKNLKINCQFVRYNGIAHSSSNNNDVILSELDL